MKKQIGIAGVLGMLVVSGFGSSVVAQSRLTIGGQRSNFGNSMFAGAPVSQAITSGGSLDVRSMNLAAGCVGFVTATPDYILRTSAPSSLNISFTSSQPAVAVSPTDTTLVVNTASGGWQCNDDTDGANPRVRIAAAPPGQYDIWVGAYQAGTNTRGTLMITR